MKSRLHTERVEKNEHSKKRGEEFVGKKGKKNSFGKTGIIVYAC